MSCDRFVRWQGEKRPPKEDLEKALIGYIGGAGTVQWDKDRFFVGLPGKPSDPFPFVVSPHDTRWFEVFLHEDAIDVITRQADEFTNVVAQGYAELCARRWEGDRDFG